jgi:hypothetical protein
MTRTRPTALAERAGAAREALRVLREAHAAAARPGRERPAPGRARTPQRPPTRPLTTTTGEGTT